jgi:hypothetical protein
MKNMGVQLGQFINTAGYRRGIMSNYLDSEKVEYGDIESVGMRSLR